MQWRIGVAFIVLCVPLFLLAEEPKANYTGDEDKCVVEVVSIVDGAQKTTVDKTSERYQLCRKANNNTGCTLESEKAGLCKCGTVTFSGISGKTCPAVSKCLPKEEQQRIVQPCLKSGALQDISSKAVVELGNKINSSNPTVAAEGQKQLSSVLQQMGVDQSKADNIVSTHEGRMNAYEMLRATARGDETTAQAIAEQRLGLNSELSSSISRLSPDSMAQKLADGGALDRAHLEQVRAQTTGFGTAPAAQPQSRVAETLAPMCQQLGGCGQACAYRPSSLVCRTNNPGAVVDSAIARRFGCSACGQTNNTACCPTMEQGVALQTALLSSSNRYFASGNNSILGAICNGYAEANCQQYAYFVARQVGVSPHTTIDPKNTEMMGRIVMAMSRFENGNGVIFTPQQLQSGMQMAFGGLPAGTPGFSSRFVTGTGDSGLQYRSPFSIGSSPVGYAQPASYGGGVPYPSYGSGYGSGFGGSYAGGYTPYPQPQPAQPTPNPVPIRPTPTPTPTPNPPAPVQPIATIIAQPKEVMRGANIIVSWSSVGMNQSTPCQVVMNVGSSSEQIAIGNEGTRTISDARANTEFVLRCTALSGSVHVDRTSVIVR